MVARPLLGYRCHLCVGAPRSQLLPLDRTQCGASLIVSDPLVSGRLDPLALLRGSTSACSVAYTVKSALKSHSTSILPLISVVVPLAGNTVSTISMASILLLYVPCAVSTHRMYDGAYGVLEIHHQRTGAERLRPEGAEGRGHKAHDLPKITLTFKT
ncbi:hypothetical protein EVAR_45874_1 [Eumeta japonica]|uniref:Uncharacterized protein n=1 Tax=Eumeta variegata TaxID=151549 RepID=A0A4C1WPL8_EUMVA|nr:hypothetical protein EVAR_45874_1 [Eumeta japonica]